MPVRRLLPLLLLLACAALPVHALWPLPQRVSLTSDNSSVELGISSGFDFVVESSSPVLRTAVARYRSQYLFPLGAARYSCASRCLCSARITVLSDLEELQLGTDESYRITVSAADPPEAILTANTVYGAIRALETFAQLVEWSDVYATYTIKGAPLVIEDWPRFPWRGLMLDTGRHFLSIDSIKRMIVGIALNKMNTLHWHVTDSQSFPLRLKSAPLLAEKGAYAPDATYSVEDVKELVEYARSWGVRVVPEFDMPSHILAWTRGYPFAVKCSGVSNDMIPFDPTNEGLYALLDSVFGELAPLFPDAYLHIGGDEVKTFCWDRDPTIRAWMRAQGMASGEDLWRYFASRLQPILAKHGWGKFVMWYEMYQHNITWSNLNDTLTEVWMDPDQMPGPVGAGRKTLLAGGYYLDQQVPDSHNPPNYLWVDTWVSFWRNDPHMYLYTDAEKRLVQGGEACMWGEQVDSVNVDGRIWPRASGTAERLWSAPTPSTSSQAIAAARLRLVAFRCRLARLGIRAGPVTPDYCSLAPPALVLPCAPTTPCMCAEPATAEPTATATPAATDTVAPTPPPSTLPSSSCPVPHTLPACLQPSHTPCFTPAPRPLVSEPLVIALVLGALALGTAIGFALAKFAARPAQPAYVALRAPAVEARAGDETETKM